MKHILKIELSVLPRFSTLKDYMRWTQAFIPTLREAPQDAEIASHQLLIRGGYIRRLTGGVYTFLPLGLRVLRNIERIVREEMDRSGALEILMPALQPQDLWQKGPRFDAARSVMFAAQSLGSGRKAGSELVLGPTHEEVVTYLTANEIQSYRQLPRTFYQIQTKFRDEIRPRFGLMRAKEFSMKDAYSFDVDDASAERSYKSMYDTYVRIFDRTGLKYRVVEADTGVMGGSFSHEFAVPCTIGESEIAFTDDGTYAASIEKARGMPSQRSAPGASAPLEKFATPGITTIEALTKAHGISSIDQIKTLVYVCDSKVVLLLLRGDHVLNEAKVGALGYSVFRPASDTEIFQALGAHAGSLGAVGVKPSPAISAILADEALKDQRGMVTGANEDGFHLKHVDVSRDIVPTKWADLRQIQAGELSLGGGKPLRIERAIEVGHVFKLGTKYSEAFKALYLDEGGKTHPMVMGCYGIGVTRTLQAIVEQSHDKDGIIWPMEVSPFRVIVQLLEVGNEKVTASAEDFYTRLKSAGVEVLFDDRDERPGVKFKDADLLGIPFQIRFGKKFIESGRVELKRRATRETSDCEPSQVESFLNP